MTTRRQFICTGIASFAAGVLAGSIVRKQAQPPLVGQNDEDIDHEVVLSDAIVRLRAAEAEDPGVDFIVWIMVLEAIVLIVKFWCLFTAERARNIGPLTVLRLKRQLRGSGIDVDRAVAIMQRVANAASDEDLAKFVRAVNAAAREL